MNTLLPFYSTDQLVQKIAPAVPPEVQTGQVLVDFAHYGLLVACLTAVIALLCSSLLLVLNYPSVKPVQPTLRLIRSAPANRQPKRPAENRVARANRSSSRLVAGRALAFWCFSLLSLPQLLESFSYALEKEELEAIIHPHRIGTTE